MHAHPICPLRASSFKQSCYPAVHCSVAPAIDGVLQEPVRKEPVSRVQVLCITWGGAFFYVPVTLPSWAVLLAVLHSDCSLSRSPRWPCRSQHARSR